MKASLTFQPTRLIRPEWLLLMVACFWGTSYGLTKTALAYTSVLLFIAIRFLITHLLLAYWTWQECRHHAFRDWLIAIPTGALLLGIFCFEVYGVSQTSAANAAFLISLSILFTALLEKCISNTAFESRLIWLAGLSLMGVFCLTYPESFQLRFNTGDKFILGAAFLRGLMVVLTKRLSQNKPISNLSLTSIQALIVGAGALVLAYFTLDSAEFSLPKETAFWSICLYLILFCTLFAFYIQNLTVRQISATKVSLLMGSEPLFGALFAIVWLGESFSMIQMAGGAAILLSVLMASKPQQAPSSTSVNQ